MNAFVKYSLARLALAIASIALVWLVTFSWVEIGQAYVWLVLLLGLVLSSISSIFLLSRLRDQVAVSLEKRGAQMKQRFEESRSAEDID